MLQQLNVVGDSCVKKKGGYFADKL